MISVKPKKEPSWNIVTSMPFYQSSGSHITTVLMMLSVKPEQSDDTNELFGEEVPVSIAPEVLTVEGEEARQAKDSVALDA